MNHCGCGFIHFSGRKLSLANTPRQMRGHIPADTRQTTLFLISPKSIHLQDSCVANISRIANNMYVIECRRCWEKLVLFENNNACFLLYIKNTQKPSRRQSDPVFYRPIGPCLINPAARYVIDDSSHKENDIPFCSHIEEQLPPCEADNGIDNDDFNFMFSANRSIVIGSYRDSLTDSPDSFSPVQL